MGASSSGTSKWRRWFVAGLLGVAVLAIWFLLQPSDPPKIVVADNDRIVTSTPAQAGKTPELSPPAPQPVSREGIADALQAQALPTAKVLGPQRIVSGWVLDVHKQPVANASVTAAVHVDPTEQPKPATTVRTGADGAFSVAVDVAEARIAATGPNGAMAAVNIDAGDEARSDVLLVLVDSGTIIVHVADERMRSMPVIVTSHDSGVFGPPEPGLEDVVLDAEPETEAPSEPSEPSLFEDESRMIGLIDHFEDGLRSWKADDPEGSLVRIGIRMLQVEPELEAMIRNDLPPELAHLADADTASLMTEMVQVALKKEPVMAAVVGAVAMQLKAEPDTRLVTLMEHGGLESHFSDSVAAAAEAYEVEEGDNEASAEQPFETAPAVDEVSPDPLIPGEEEVSLTGDESFEDQGYSDLALGDDAEADDPVGDEVSQFDLALEGLRQRFGEDVPLQGPTRAELVIARGRVSEPIFVRGGHSYLVGLATGESGFQIDCGAVRVGLGQTVEWTCGAAGSGMVSGRVVDSAGRPVVAAEIVPIALEGRDVDERAMSGVDGRFELQVVVVQSAPTRILVAKGLGDSRREGQIQAVNLAPGREVDVGDVVVRSTGELARGNIFGLWCGVIGGGLSETDHGIVIDDVAPELELGQFGVEKGDTLVQWGELDLTQVSLDELMMRLQPTANGFVENDLGDIIMRSPRGEVYTLDPATFADPGFSGFD